MINYIRARVASNDAKSYAVGITEAQVTDLFRNSVMSTIVIPKDAANGFSEKELRIARIAIQRKYHLADLYDDLSLHSVAQDDGAMVITFELERPEPKSYAEKLATSITRQDDEGLDVLHDGISATAGTLFASLENFAAQENVYVEMDRQVIARLESGAMKPQDLLQYLEVLVARHDVDGDVILHITTTEIALS